MQQNTREDQLKQEIEDWVTQFADLLMQDDRLDETELRERLANIHHAKQKGGLLSTKTGSLRGPDHADLVGTLENAVSRLDTMELDTQLALDRLGLPLDKMAEPATEPLEVGSAEFDSLGGVLDELVAKPSWSKAMSMGFFALFWNGFVYVHMFFMMSGFIGSFGWAGLLLILFYIPFIGVGAAMATGAFQAVTRKSVLISGRQITRIRKAFGMTWTKTWTLQKNSPVTMESPVWGVRNSKTKNQAEQITLRSIEGKKIHIGTPIFNSDRDYLVAKIKSYLATS